MGPLGNAIYWEERVTMKMMLTRGLLCLGLLAVAVFASACATTKAHPQALSGGVEHERHATGMDSQVSDN